MIEQAPGVAPSGPTRRTFLTGAAAAAGTAATVAAVGVNAPPAPGAPRRFPLPSKSAATLRVLVTGDAGTGKKPQFDVAAAARKLHKADPFHLAVGLGDNIYESGPNGPDDKQFQTKFEKPNTGLDFPWLMTLGNHDTSAIFPGDGGWLLRGNDEVKYHNRSRRWYMPDRYYSVRAGAAEFFMVDLNPLAAYIPPILSPEWEPGGQYMTRQGRWLDKALRESTAQWKFVCTHHPYANNGPHGPAGDYDGLPAPLNGIHAKKWIERHISGKAQFMLSGHDHSQQVLENVRGLRGTRQIVSGAAAKVVNKTSSREFRARYENYRDRGFMTLEVTASSVELTAYQVPANTTTARAKFSTTYRR